MKRKEIRAQELAVNIRRRIYCDIAVRIKKTIIYVYCHTLQYYNDFVFFLRTSITFVERNWITLKTENCR